MTVPDAFDDRLREWGAPDAFDDDAPCSPEQLVEAGARALERSIEPEGRERRGAFDLLAADAFFTRAAECALDEGDPAAVLLRMASAIADGGRNSSGSGQERPAGSDATPAD